MEALGEEQELALSLLEQVASAGHLRLGGVLARAGEAHVGLLHVVAEADVVEVRRHVDQRVGHDRVLVLRQHLLHEELEADGEGGGGGGAGGVRAGQVTGHLNIDNRKTGKDEKKS